MHEIEPRSGGWFWIGAWNVPEEGDAVGRPSAGGGTKAETPGAAASSDMVEKARPTEDGHDIDSDEERTSNIEHSTLNAEMERAGPRWVTGEVSDYRNYRGFVHEQKRHGPMMIDGAGEWRVNDDPSIWEKFIIEWWWEEED